ncbi:MAG: RICIN domain-containing protein [Pseudomonadales bacterium]|nr:RICIN domain-containing protein [Pseudomonadales bacterium]
MQTLPINPGKFGNLRMLTLVAIAVLSSACGWLPPPTEEEIFLDPIAETNFGDTLGTITLSALPETSCFTLDSSLPAFEEGACDGIGRSALYTAPIDIKCNLYEAGNASLRRVVVGFEWPGEPDEDGNATPATVEYRAANFYLDCGDDTDGDGDGIADIYDNCPSTPNFDQDNWNEEEDSVGDACDDTDADTVLDIGDNCIEVANSLQEDYDDDNIGNACEEGGNGYYFYNSRTTDCIFAASTGNAAASECLSNDLLTADPAGERLFTIEEIEETGTYQIRSFATDECVAYDSNNTNGSGDEIYAAACDGTNFRIWEFTESVNIATEYQISTVANGNCLRNDDDHGLHGFDCSTNSGKADWQIFDKDTHELIDPTTL